MLVIRKWNQGQVRITHLPFFYGWNGRKLGSEAGNGQKMETKRCLLSQLEILGEKYSIQNFAE